MSKTLLDVARIIVNHLPHKDNDESHVRIDRDLFDELRKAVYGSNMEQSGRAKRLRDRVVGKKAS